MRKTLLLVAILLLVGFGISFAGQFKYCDRYQWLYKRDAFFGGRAGYYAYLYDLEDTTTIADSTAIDSLSYFCFNITHAGEYWIKVEGQWYDKIAVPACSIAAGEVYIDTLNVNEGRFDEVILGESVSDDGAIMLYVRNSSGSVLNVGNPVTFDPDSVFVKSYQSNAETTCAAAVTLAGSTTYWAISVITHGTMANDSVALFGTTLTSGVSADTMALVATDAQMITSKHLFGQIDSFQTFGGGSALDGDSITIVANYYLSVTDAAANENEFMGIVFPDSIADKAVGTVAILGVCWGKVDGAADDLVSPGELLLCGGSGKLNETTVDSLAVAIALGTCAAGDDSIKVLLYKMGK